MNIFKSTKKYEKWLSKQILIVPPDLALKHKSMAESPFPFLRATFYRWIQLFDKNCEDLTNSPNVLGVGDLHVENFGTWRDLEGRLIWGINDFDEAYFLPYTNDLVRLTASAYLAIRENHLKLNKEDACESILQGYKDSISSGGSAFVLNEEKHKWLHDTATYRLKDPVVFWNKLNSFKENKKDVSDSLIKTLFKTMPGHDAKYKVVQRIAGLGSLGRQRFVVITEWSGGKIAREAKAFVASAYTFVNKSLSLKSYYNTILDISVRCKDPFVILKKNWIIRRLAPDCSRIELSSLPKEHDEKKLLYAMGWETSNIHMGTKTAIKNIQKDLAKKNKNWLPKASEIMLDAIDNDYSEWKKEYEKGKNKI
jgi:hypothetical protein